MRLRVLLELALRKVDIERRARRRHRLVVGGRLAGANLASILLKAIVWKCSLDAVPGTAASATAHVVPALFIGFLLNTLLVARLGEIARIAVLPRRLN